MISKDVHYNIPNKVFLTLCLSTLIAFFIFTDVSHYSIGYWRSFSY